MRSLNTPIDRNVLKEQSHFFALKLNIKDFKVSNGWLKKSKFWNDLSFRKVGDGCTDTYYANNKAWKTGNIYKKWLRDLDCHFSAKFS